MALPGVKPLAGRCLVRTPVVAAILTTSIAIQGCRPKPPPPPVPPPPPTEPEPVEPAPDVDQDGAEERLTATITSRAVHSVADLQQLGPVAPYEYRVHLIDVGTGLAILVQGHDFSMLFDGGSADDKRGISTSAGNRSRLVAYLWAVLGPSGPAECKPVGDNWPAYDGGASVTIQHVVLSHPHEDHGVLLDDVLYCFDVDHVWDSGAVNDTVFYEDFVRAVAAEPGVTYHTAALVPASRTITVRGSAINFGNTPWTTIDELDVAELGQGAKFIVLHADGDQHSDPNENSLVLRVELQTETAVASILLTGDAESGPRELPSAAVGDIEAHLLTLHGGLLDADVLQVGHHGSLTSSRRAFLDAVSPTWALIGCGPKEYAGHKLPDVEITDELVDVGATVLRTDVNDAGACPVADKIGADDQRPGGCDNWVLEIR